ncbi:hypothetical protein C8R47DRAFT_1079627 [Mycena vitilis]|nr:hypothetical protein C8R47DRAFT_1079627 [Mycena vitilis]
MENPFQFRRWLHHHATGIPPAHDVFGGAAHVPGMWHSFRNSDGTWGPEGGIMDASRWLPGLPVVSWTWDCPPTTRKPGSRDPNWDGTLVPKCPGKAKRRKLRRREEAPLLAALRDAQERAMGWEMGQGWGGDWLTESEWDVRLAEPRAAVERARAALAPMYYIRPPPQSPSFPRDQTSIVALSAVVLSLSPLPRSSRPPPAAPDAQSLRDTCIATKHILVPIPPLRLSMLCPLGLRLTGAQPRHTLSRFLATILKMPVWLAAWPDGGAAVPRRLRIFSNLMRALSVVWWRDLTQSGRRLSISVKRLPVFGGNWLMRLTRNTFPPTIQTPF